MYYGYCAMFKITVKHVQRIIQLHVETSVSDSNQNDHVMRTRTFKTTVRQFIYSNERKFFFNNVKSMYEIKIAFYTSVMSTLI